jgi:hypothetical protein
LSTDIYNNNEEHVATRYYGGKDKGMEIQMHLTPFEYENRKHEKLSPGNFGVIPGETIHQFVARHDTKATVKWDSAQRRHDLADRAEDTEVKFRMGSFGSSHLRNKAKEAADQVLKHKALIMLGNTLNK